MSTIELKAYDVLKAHFKTEEDARLIIDFVEQTAKSKIDDKQLANKTDIKELELKIEQVKSEMLKWFIGLFVMLALMIIGLYMKI